jgi:sulfite reductase alpha subunit-like flavoprotein
METWTEAKQVVYLELKLNDSGITYTPGDSIGITCPNPQYLINIVFERLKSSLALSGHDADITLDTYVHVKNKKIMTLRELLSYHMDLVMPPKKAAVAILASCCTDESEAQQLLYLCSKLEVGKLLWREFLENQGVGIGEPCCCELV